MHLTAPKENMIPQGCAKKCFVTARDGPVFSKNESQLRAPRKEASKVMQFSAEFIGNGLEQFAFLSYFPKHAGRRIRHCNKFWLTEDHRITKKIRSDLRWSIEAFFLGVTIYFIRNDASNCANFQATVSNFVLTGSSCPPSESSAVFQKKRCSGRVCELGEANLTGPKSPKYSGSSDLNSTIISHKNRQRFLNKKFKSPISGPSGPHHSRYDGDAKGKKLNVLDQLDNVRDVAFKQSVDI